MMHLAQGLLQRGHELGCTLAVVLQQLISHALRRFGADIGQHFQGIDQAGKRIVFFRHGFQTACGQKLDYTLYVHSKK